MIFCVKNIRRMISLKNFNIYIHDTQLSKIGFFFSHECNGLTLAAIYMAQRREGSIITQISI